MKKMTTAQFIVCLLCLCPVLCMAQDRYNDSLALVALHNATDGTNWTNTWNLTQPMDTWYGVNLNENGRVDFLDLSSNQLSGNIPPDIGNLTDLGALDLYSNQLTDNIPSEIGNLTNLTRLWLSGNQLTGNIPPEIGDMTSLITVILSYNQLTGNIPVEITTLTTNLGWLSLGGNQLSGTIPPEFGNMTNLVGLGLENNQLTGNIPPEIGNMTNLEGIGLSGNQLSGSIPAAIGGLTNLKDLYLTDNQLTGNIPPEIENLTNLQALYLYDNQLTGSIPTSIGNLTNLKIISAYNNQLTGNIPASIGNMTSLEELLLGNNQLNDSIPTSTGNLANLTALVLSDNQLTGSIPASIGNLSNLTGLYLNGNQLTGSIPSEIGNMMNLTDLWISGNQFSGCYDDNLANLCNELSCNVNDCISFGNSFAASWENFCNTGEGACSTYIPCRQGDSLALVALYESTGGANWINTWDLSLPMDNWYGISLDLNGCVTCIDMDGGDRDCEGDYSDDGNNLSGNIPPEIDSLNNLKELNLMNNRLRGSIPPEIGSLNELISMLLGGNQISGNIPPEIGNLIELQALDLGSNKLSGSIPPEIGNLDKISTLNLWSNQLEGSIPPEIGNLNNLGYLTLFDNRLTDNIPPEIGNLTDLRLIYLHDNQLTGSIPIEMISLDSLKDLRLSGNQLTGNIPDLPPDLATLHLHENKFSYDEIEAIYNSNSFDNFQYSPQYHGEPQGYTQNFGDTLTITLSEPLPGNNNQNVSYQWKKNYNYLAGSTDFIYSINDLQLSDVGEYTLKMTDPSRVPDLEIISEPIYVIVPGYDLYGQPVEYNQIMVEFDSEEDRIYYENNYLLSNGYVAKSCNCNRELYLWQFESDEAALETLLELNTRKENIGRGRTRVDGGLNNIFNVGPIVSGEGWTWRGDYSENYPDSVLVFLLDSGTDTLHWDVSPYLLDDAPVDNCYDIPMGSGFNYTDTLNTINSDFTDSLGHGTYGFRSIAEDLGNSINLNVVPLKVFDKEGQGTLFNFVCAVYHAIDHDADIIHVSAGYTGTASGVLENAIALSKEKGCFLVTAAGNDGVDIDSIPQYPAYYAKEFYKKGYNGNDSLVHYNNVISVASISPQDELSVFSNHSNSSVLISAYGEDMNGYDHTGQQISSSGTSVSAFYVTRELAVEIAKNSNRTYEQIWQDFEANRLRDCPATVGFTKTGKCLDITLNEIYGDLRVYLEGAYDTIENKMRNELNVRHLLPGQTCVDSILNHGMAIQPYGDIPPYYQGDESVPESFQNYPNEVVDWILISLRTETTADTELSRTAAWVLDNGDIQLLRPLLDDIHTAPDSVFVVVEHRNHLWTMSPEKIPVNRNIITWDFTTQDGYRTPTTTGQIETQPGIWAMLAGDSQQDDIEGGDINGSDKIIWLNDNGYFLLYLPGDYNLNGDTNGEDKGIWERNNGKFSGVPR